LLAFTNVYFSESGLFNGLRPIQIKKFPAFPNSLPGCETAPPLRSLLNRQHSTRLAERLAPPPGVNPDIKKNSGLDFCFCQVFSIDNAGFRKSAGAGWPLS
jgi:hypothetical protein